MSMNYCEKNSLKFNESPTIKDLGLSAFHGTHIKVDVLGHFLQAIETGEVQRGSTFLIEDFDRLSSKSHLMLKTLFAKYLKKVSPL